MALQLVNGRLVVVPDDAGIASLINQIYQEELGGNADAGGLQFYTDLVKSGVPIETIRAQIDDSPEGRVFDELQQASGSRQTITDMGQASAFDLATQNIYGTDPYVEAVQTFQEEAYKPKTTTRPGTGTDSTSRADELAQYGYINDLYLNYLGRPATLAELQGYAQRFGSSVDNNERRKFILGAVESGEISQKRADVLLAALGFGVTEPVDKDVTDKDVTDTDTTKTTTKESEDIINRLLYQPILGRKGDPSGLAFYRGLFLNDGIISPAERAQFIQGAVEKGELSQRAADAYLGTIPSTPSFLQAGATARGIEDPNFLRTSPTSAVRPILGLTGLPTTSQNIQNLYQSYLGRTPSPQEIAIQQQIMGPVISPEKAYDFTGAVAKELESAQGPRDFGGASLLAPPPTFTQPTLTTTAPALAAPGAAAALPVESRAGGMISYQEGGDVEGGMPKATPAELGSKFDISEFIDEQGRLVGGYSRPIRDEFGVIIGYEDRPYEEDVVFGEELRRRETAARSAMTDEERQMALLDMMARQGRTGVSPITGGLAGIQVGGPMMRTQPQYYSTIEAGRRYRGFAEGGLANAAQNLARRGRGGDSMLVHMAPEEVSGLRALARAQGNDLTINPNTGLPEAFSLKKLFRAASFVLPFIPIPGLFGMSSLLTRSILSGVAAGASAKGKFDFKQALGGGLRAYAMGSLGEKLGGGPAAGQGTAPTTAAAPEAATVDVMGAGAPTITTPSGDVSLASSYTGAGGTPIGPQSLSADLTAPLKVGSGYTDVAAAPIYNAPIGPGGGPGTQLTGGSLPPGADTVPGRAASIITPEGQGFGQPLTKGTEIAMAGLGGLSIEEGAKEARNYEIQAAAARREEDERQRRFNELFRRTLGTVPVRSGGRINLAKGGMTYMEAGGTTDVTGEPRVVRGTGDGMSDSVPATIEGVQEARLANDEFVIPADVVSDIGNGSSDAGAKKLYGMMDRVRKARHGTTKQPPEINAESMMPA